MNQSSFPKTSALAEAWRVLVLPILLFLLSSFLIVYDNILDPPGDAQGTSGVGLVLIAFSLGLGFDIARLKGGGSP